MQNYEQILAELGIEIPEEKKAELKKRHAENYKTVADYNKQVEKKDEYKTSLDDVQTRLAELEKEDVDGLKAKITTLTQELADEKAENLPYGKQRKLEIARALATDMKLLLLDEPAAGMNPTETAELLESINLIREKFKISILLIEHDMSLVMNVCERIIVLNYGEILTAGTPEEIARNPKVISAYLGD